MAKRKRGMTPEKIEEWRKEGRGLGEGPTYKPWYTIQDVASQGLATRIWGWKARRLHHLLSKLELLYFLVLEWSSLVLDIREQYPLFPMEVTRDIAEQCGIRHPTDPTTRCQVPLTTDFLILVRDGPDDRLCARTVKYAKDLSKARNIAKFEIERQYWQARGIDWGIVTERDIPEGLAANVQLILAT